MVTIDVDQDEIHHTRQLFSFKNKRNVFVVGRRMSIVAMFCVIVFNMTNVLTDETTSRTLSCIMNQTQGIDAELFFRSGIEDKLRDGLCDTPNNALLCQSHYTVVS